MQLYGYKSAHSKSLKNRRGICYCCCCEADERHNRDNKKRNRKRARRLGKEEIREMVL